MGLHSVPEGLARWQAVNDGDSGGWGEEEVVSLTGTFSCMPVKVNSVRAPSTSSRRMAWMAPLV